MLCKRALEKLNFRKQGVGANTIKFVPFYTWARHPRDEVESILSAVLHSFTIGAQD